MVVTIEIILTQRIQFSVIDARAVATRLNIDADSFWKVVGTTCYYYFPRGNFYIALTFNDWDQDDSLSYEP